MSGLIYNRGHTLELSHGLNFYSLFSEDYITQYYVIEFVFECSFLQVLQVVFTSFLPLTIVSLLYKVLLSPLCNLLMNSTDIVQYL